MSNLQKAFNTINTWLSKGGAGSRGGKVIGHTKSGKVIYGPTSGHRTLHEEASKKPTRSWDGYGGQGFTSEQTRHTSAHHEKHSEFTAEDHYDAAATHHQEIAKRHAKKKSTDAHSDLADYHLKHAERDHAHELDTYGSSKRKTRLEGHRREWHEAVKTGKKASNKRFGGDGNLHPHDKHMPGFKHR